MNDHSDNNDIYPILKNAVIIATIIAIIITGYLLFFNMEHHSSLYIIPESYKNLTPGNDISFTYGVFCSEKETTDYDIQILMNNKIVQTEQFQLNNNEHYEKNSRLKMTNNITYPVKVQVILDNGISMEEVHFWVEYE